MRLDEINKPNRLWGKLRGVDFDTVQEYNNIVQLLKTLIQLNSPYRSATFAHTIQVFDDILTDLINADYTGYPDNNDIKEFKGKCNKMLRNIQYLKSQLP